MGGGGYLFVWFDFVFAFNCWGFFFFFFLFYFLLGVVCFCVLFCF